MVKESIIAILHRYRPDIVIDNDVTEVIPFEYGAPKKQERTRLQSKALHITLPCLIPQQSEYSTPGGLYALCLRFERTR